eukprot:jgi/Botrbrau1/12147/Bobra.0186s0059.2
MAAFVEPAEPATYAGLGVTSGPVVYQAPRKPDSLDKTVAFLKKRDGIDKVLKIIRYTAKLVLATALSGSDTELARRLKRFEASIGTSRKAYRLGKFLQDVNDIRKTPSTTRTAMLEMIASGGEGVYYFVEQFTWLIKAGLLDKRYARRFARISAWAELVGYMGSITLNCMRIATNLERETALTQDLANRKKHDMISWQGEEALLTELRQLAERRALRTLAVTQDLCDSLLALNDINGKNSRTFLAHTCIHSYIV